MYICRSWQCRGTLPWSSATDGRPGADRNGRIPFSARMDTCPGLTMNNYPRHYSPPAPGLECCIIAAILGRVMDSFMAQWLNTRQVWSMQ